MTFVSIFKMQVSYTPLSYGQWLTLLLITIGREPKTCLLWRRDLNMVLTILIVRAKDEKNYKMRMVQHRFSWEKLKTSFESLDDEVRQHGIWDKHYPTDWRLGFKCHFYYLSPIWPAANERPRASIFLNL